MGLRCNYQVGTVVINKQTPVFSWEINAESGRNVYQTAYQVLVATSPGLLSEEKADIWNSGVVASPRSVGAPYGGPPLQSRQRYFWKVRVKTNYAAFGPWSHPAGFEAALLQQDDWQAEWIAAPSVWNWNEFLKRRNEGKVEVSPWDDRAPLFRKAFKLEKKVKSARLFVTGIGYYEAYINGRRLDTRYLDPAFTRYDRRVLYSVYDISTILKPQNAIGLMVGNGWYNMFTNAVWGFDHAPWRGKPRALAQLEVTFEDGTSQTIVSDGSWKTAPSPLVFNSIRQGTVWDARLEQEGWTSAAFDDTSWEDVFTVSSPGGALHAQTIEPVRAFEELKPREIRKTENGRFLIDFGQNMAGVVRIKAEGKAGDEIVLKYAEIASGDTVDQSNIGVYTNGFVQIDRYILKGGEEEVFETKFTYHGFRYVEVSGYPGELKKDDITALAVSTGFEKRGDFSCSDPVINKIQHNTLWSYRSNFIGYPTDCPHREKNGWTGDAQLASEAGLWNFHAHSAYAKFLQDFADEQRPDGNLAAIIPTSQWGYQWGNGPAWIGAYFIIPWNMYQYDGDTAILAEHYEGMKKLFSHFESLSKDYLLPTGLGDWAAYKTKAPVVITSTAYFYQFAKILSKAAAMTGRTEESRHYEEMALKIRKAFNEKFYDRKTGLYGKGSQTAQSCALYFGLVEEKERKKVVRQLVELVRKTDNHIDTGILGAKFLLNALSDNGHAELALQVVTNETLPSWKYWIKQGATTLWEFWDGRESQAVGSFNHIAFGDVSNWFYRSIAGIRPVKAGFREFVIAPKLTDKFDWCRVDFESPYGTIGVHWRNENGRFFMDIEVPANTTALVTLLAKELKENGLPLKKSGIEVVESSGGVVTVRVGSGKYSFESAMKK